MVYGFDSHDKAVTGFGAKPDRSPETKQENPSEYQRGYRQGFQAALVTVDLSRQIDENARRQVVQILREAFAKLGGVI